MAKEPEIKSLTNFLHLRKRTEMYFGSRNAHTQSVILYNDSLEPYLKEVTWVPALYTYFREILDNSLDEVCSFGFGNSVWIEFNPETFIFSVEDNGRGIPISWNEEHNMYNATLALSQTMTGRNFETRGDVAGTNGIGASGTNFCSEWFHLEIIRDGKKFSQEFSEGNVILDDNLVIKKPQIKSTTSQQTGTKITFKPSKYVFETVPSLENNFILPLEFIKSRVIEVAICNPHIKVFFNGTKISVRNKPEQSLFKDKDFIAFSSEGEKFSSRFFILPKWSESQEVIHTVVNNIPAFNGGSHIDSFKRAFYKNLLEALEKESKRRKLNPNSSDIQDGILIYNITNMSAPNFDSQSKTRLINENAATIVRKSLDNEELFKSIIKKHKAWIESIYERCAERTNKKDIEDVSKLSKKLSKNKVAKLSDATSKDRRKCILLLAEGDSAIGGASSVRDPEIHAGLPLKGKVMNVHDMTPKEVLSNTELADIMNSIGLVIGQKANRFHLRYGKIYIAHDADEDGKNIGALLINFFYKFWPELFSKDEAPFIYILQTPFLIGIKGKERRYWYSHNYHEYDTEKHKEYKITRAKGLGTLTKEDWQHSLYHPELFPIVDDGDLKETLSLLFDGKRADDRKQWMGI